MSKKRMSKKRMRRMKRQKIIVSLNDVINNLGPRHFNCMPSYIQWHRWEERERERGRDGRKEEEDEGEKGKMMFLLVKLKLVKQVLLLSRSL